MLQAAPAEAAPPLEPPPDTPEAAGEAIKAGVQPSKQTKPAAGKGKDAKASSKDAAAAAAAAPAATAAATPAITSKAALLAPPMQALAHLARGVQLAVRGEAWHEALNAVGGGVRASCHHCRCCCCCVSDAAPGNNCPAAWGLPAYATS